MSTHISNGVKVILVIVDVLLAVLVVGRAAGVERIDKVMVDHAVPDMRDKVVVVARGQSRLPVTDVSAAQRWTAGKMTRASTRNRGLSIVSAVLREEIDTERIEAI